MGKQFGAIYLILGTCVAGGLLGLPVVTAQHDFAITSLMIISAWILMTAGAWCLLQVTLTMPTGANLISMSQKTLGNTVKNITWGVYLLLLYSLICAYLAASGDLLEHLFHDAHIDIPRFLATIIAAVTLGSIVVSGIRLVDLINRGLMTTKIIICLLLIGSVMPFSHLHNLTLGNTQWSNNAWLVVICAFGYAIILPSIRDYLGNDKKELTRVVMIGSLIPMILYFVWIAVIQGALSHSALIAMNNSAHTNSSLMTNIAALTHHGLVKSLSVIFISICSITGFLGVSLCLMDFLSDGTKIKKQGKNKLALGLFSFLPPTLIVIFDPAIFIRALSYAGICCLYVLIILPIAMYISNRIRQQ
ncbi:MAG: tryptophan/tyrosine permease [Gammaproteobacteria bacterium]|nr:tryptophan/tyrosine permease [Gammaproteobacteria bacterium]